MIYLPPDMELWLTTWLRARLNGVRVTNKEPADLSTPLSQPLVIIRDDGGPQLAMRTFDRSLGVTIHAGSKTTDTSPSNTRSSASSNNPTIQTGWHQPRSKPW
ncbi:MAG: hypothetical protein L0K48_03840 [Bifidobacterium mongoliense]|nr:hypothetical protein [Bifidobacterium mongoliense]